MVVTSPPYWTLKKYDDGANQLGRIADYDAFVAEIAKVWSECNRVLAPGGRLVVVVGDVCLSRRRHGRHVVYPLHASIQESCRRIGFDNLAPIIWHKIANADFEMGPGGFLGMRMFSFVGDTVLDPFMGTGTTSLAAASAGRNSVGVEVSADYLDMARRRFLAEGNDIFGLWSLEVEEQRSAPNGAA